MRTKHIIGYGLFNAAAAAAYVGLVALLLSNAGTIFGPIAGGPLAVMLFLLLFVISAAVMAVVIFGRSALWYLDGMKKEAMRLLTYTIVFLAVFAGLVFTVILFAVSG